MMKNTRMVAVSKHKIEIAIFLVIPLAVTLVFFLPPDMKNRLKVDLLGFNVPTFYTAIFTHDDLHHFLSNIVAYYLYIFLSYSLSRISQKTKWFIRNYLIFFFVFPLIMYPSLIIVNKFYLGGRLPPSCGLSGIVSAILGLTPISFLVFLRKSGVLVKMKNFILLLICASAFSIPYIYENLYFSVALVPVLAVAVWINREDIIAICRFLKKLSSQDFFSYLLATLAISLYFVGIGAIFPSTIVTEGSIIDIFTHYLGWVLGFFLSCFLLRFER